MKPAAKILLLGLTLGLATHFAYFELRKPAGSERGADHLAWMKQELNLSDDQYQRVVMLHEQSNPQLRQLALQVMQMQREMQVFENTRRDEGKVDFLEFAQFVDEFRKVSLACEDSTRSLVTATAEVLDPDQRRRYLALVRSGSPNPVKNPTQVQ